MPPPSLSEALVTIAECATSRVVPGPSVEIPAPLPALWLPSTRPEPSTLRVVEWPVAPSWSQPSSGRQVATTPPARKQVTRTRRRPRLPFRRQTPDSVRPGSWVSVHVAQPDLRRRVATETRQRGRRGRTRDGEAGARPRWSRSRGRRPAMPISCPPRGAASSSPGTSAPAEGRCGSRRPGCAVASTDLPLATAATASRMSRSRRASRTRSRPTAW